MNSFKITDRIEVVCEWKKTRTAFKHVATLLINGREIDETKICYQNRTWERYTYESVLEKLINNTTALGSEDKKVCLDYIKNYDRVEDDLKPLKMVSMVATLGSLLTDNKKGANDFKTRILKAGLENKGLSIPADWDTLTEDEKEKRLNGAISCLA